MILAPNPDYGDTPNIHGHGPDAGASAPAKQGSATDKAKAHALPSYDAFLALLDGVRPYSGGHKAYCPSCDGPSQSSDRHLTVRPGESRPFMVYCHSKAGCSYQQIMHALGLPYGGVEVSRTVKAALVCYIEDIRSHHWPANSSDLSIIEVLVMKAANRGTAHLSGVLMSMSVRQAALEAAVSHYSSRDSLKRLAGKMEGNTPRRESGCPWLSRYRPAPRRVDAAATYLLRVPQMPRSLRIANTVYVQRYLPPAVNVLDTRSPEEAEEAKAFLERADGSPDLLAPMQPVGLGEERMSTMFRRRGIGKKYQHVLRVLLARYGRATVRDIAHDMGDKRPGELLRTDPKRLGAIVRLQKLGVVSVAGDLVELTPAWGYGVGLARNHCGDDARADRDLERYDEERDRYADYLSAKGVRPLRWEVPSRTDGNNHE